MLAPRHRRPPPAHRAPDSRPFLLLALAIAEWCLASTLEVASPDLATKIAFAKLEYVGIAVVPLAWYLFATHYASRPLPARIAGGPGPGAAAHHRPRLHQRAAPPDLDQGVADADQRRAGVRRRVRRRGSGSTSSTPTCCCSMAGCPWLRAAAAAAAASFSGQAAMMLVALAAPWLANAALHRRARRRHPLRHHARRLHRHRRWHWA